MSKRRLIISSMAAVAVVAMGYGGYRYYQSQSDSSDSSSQSRPTVTVTAARASSQTWSDELTAIGTVTPIQGTRLTSELSGKVTQILFRSGQSVDKGELLVTLDTSTERAAFDALQPQLRQAKSDQQRAEQLIDSSAISEEAYEEAFAEVDRFDAKIQQQAAIIAKKRIVAPFAGKLGIRQVDLGQYIAPGTIIATLQQLDPVFVDFALPEQDSGRVAEGQPVQISVAAFPELTFTGEIESISPNLDTGTRSFVARASVANDLKKLKPGMFADVVVDLPQEREVITVPQTAIAFNAFGSSVFLIDENPESKPTVKRAFVQTGERRGLDIEIVRGVNDGQRIVTAGQIKLSDGAMVQVTQSDAVDESKIALRPSEP